MRGCFTQCLANHLREASFLHAYLPLRIFKFSIVWFLKKIYIYRCIFGFYDVHFRSKEYLPEITHISGRPKKVHISLAVGAPHHCKLLRETSDFWHSQCKRGTFSWKVEKCAILLALSPTQVHLHPKSCHDLHISGTSHTMYAQGMLSHTRARTCTRPCACAYICTCADDFAARICADCACVQNLIFSLLFTFRERVKELGLVWWTVWHVSMIEEWCSSKDFMICVAMIEEWCFLEEGTLRHLRCGVSRRNCTVRSEIR